MHLSYVLFQPVCPLFDLTEANSGYRYPTALPQSLHQQQPEPPPKIQASNSFSWAPARPAPWRLVSGSPRNGYGRYIRTRAGSSRVLWIGIGISGFRHSLHLLHLIFLSSCIIVHFLVGIYTSWIGYVLVLSMIPILHCMDKCIHTGTHIHMYIYISINKKYCLHTDTSIHNSASLASYDCELRHRWYLATNRSW